MTPKVCYKDLRNKSKMFFMLIPGACFSNTNQNFGIINSGLNDQILKIFKTETFRPLLIT